MIDTLWIATCVACEGDIPVTAEALAGVDVRCPECGAVYRLTFEFVRDGEEQ